VKAPWTATPTPSPRKACLGAGFVAASLLGSLGGQPAGAYQATFNLQVANVTGQNSRTFTDGTPTDHTMVMTVNSFDKSLTTPNNSTDSPLGTARDVTTASSPNGGLCVISPNCGVAQQTAAVQFSFTKPIKDFSFKVGLNTPPTARWSSTAEGNVYTSYLRFFVPGSGPIDRALTGLTASTTNIYSFTPSILVAADTAITVGLYCDGTGCPDLAGSDFYISDVIVEAPAPLPLIGTGAAFAWTRRLRRRIKTSPVQSARS